MIVEGIGFEWIIIEDYISVLIIMGIVVRILMLLFEVNF